MKDMKILENILCRIFYIIMAYFILIVMMLLGIGLAVICIFSIPFLLFVSQDKFKDIINGKIKKG